MLRKNFLSTAMILWALGASGEAVTASHAQAGTIAGTVARVASGQVSLRTGPATAYKLIAMVPMGAKVQIYGCLSNKTWCSLGYDGKVGWASARYVNVANVPTIAFKKVPVKSNSMIKLPKVKKEKVKQIVSDFKALPMMQKTRKNMQKLYRTDVIIDSTGVKKRDERTILNPSPKAQKVSVKHVNAYNPFFPDKVNDKNFERNETRYRVVTYPAP
ncbi:SH3 domain-containing protein [Bartonella krasnovii]|uniref:SH3 domain-containing protein n=1 Tax=Bartonella krasnovii TaxID=2267275 RepID=A0A5B9D353_9HYPH|nr:SH3 domain-containing protein [Bartonella krasnovii]QEE12581.1 SH3 domain-containing protein [Bartonella krasnovii]UNF28684.1 SH3 domain-containing protein [Bartonella krasnovii]UNF35060.1 SH3 domain-containing protein [Bartonella krasnovii]UNF36691.1 SH3 domain-containing protein [Bartonella krasnovii]UNF38318.1 SH3 domain-containing protein [Bartonella krasnovii]